MQNVDSENNNAEPPENVVEKKQEVKFDKRQVRADGEQLCDDFGRLVEFLKERKRRDCLSKENLEKLTQDWSSMIEELKAHIAVREAQSASGRRSGAKSRERHVQQVDDGPRRVSEMGPEFT
jgi:hypothetical protein